MAGRRQTTWGIHRLEGHRRGLLVQFRGTVQNFLGNERGIGLWAGAHLSWQGILGSFFLVKASEFG
jgi:hypothetical protein